MIMATSLFMSEVLDTENGICKASSCQVLPCDPEPGADWLPTLVMLHVFSSVDAATPHTPDPVLSAWKWANEVCVLLCPFPLPLLGKLAYRGIFSASVAGESLHEHCHASLI